eukprot:5425216-Prorocentrum_lima.AAC.1
MEERNMMMPQLPTATIPTVPALPIRRSLRIELDLISQHAHHSGAVVLRQGGYGRGLEQQPVLQ